MDARSSLSSTSPDKRVFFSSSLRLSGEKGNLRRTQLVSIRRFRCFYWLEENYERLLPRVEFFSTLNWLLSRRSTFIYYWCMTTRNSFSTHNSARRPFEISTRERFSSAWIARISIYIIFLNIFHPHLVRLSLPCQRSRKEIFYIIIKTHIHQLILNIICYIMVIWFQLNAFAPWFARKGNETNPFDEVRESEENCGENQRERDRETKHCQPRTRAGENVRLEEKHLSHPLSWLSMSTRASSRRKWALIHQMARKKMK